MTPEIARTGLVQTLAKAFRDQNHVTVHLRVLTDGQMLQLARSGELQIVVTSDPQAYSLQPSIVRLTQTFAHQNFAIFGPADDPADVRGASNATEAFRRMARRQVRYCSPADIPRLSDMEQSLIHRAEIDVAAWRRFSICRGDNRTVLFDAQKKRSYTINDAEAISLTKSRRFKVLMSNDHDLQNSYSIILLDRAVQDRRDRDAEWFVEWVMSYRGRETVRAAANNGEPPGPDGDTPAMK